MLALAALIAFIIAIVVHGGVHGYVFWMLLGFALVAADRLLVGLGWDERVYPRRRT